METDQFWQVPIAPDFQFIRVSVAHDGKNIVPLIFRTEAGDRCVDYQGISADLKQVIECCSLYLGSDDDKHIERTALYECCLIRYRRCFATGVRASLGEDALGKFTEAERQTHNYFIDMASKFIAHSVNSSETLLPVVIPGAGPNGGHGHAFLNVRHTGDSNNKLQQLCSLSAKILTETVDPIISISSASYELEVSQLTEIELSKLIPAHIPVNTKAVPGSRRS